jgi:hypothetical protein
MFGNMAGIKTDLPGYRRFTIKPEIFFVYLVNKSAFKI